MAEWDYEDCWKETLKQTRQKLGEEEFCVWFNNLEYIKADETGVSIAVPSKFYRDQLRMRYQGGLETTLKDLTGKDLTVLFEVIPRKTADSGPERGGAPDKSVQNSPKSGSGPENSPKPPGKKVRHPQLREDYRFDNYVIGENNNFAANAAIAISRNPGTAYNPYLIYGGVGLGKTHLMQAIGNYIHENSENKIIYITAENFLNEFLQALKENKMNVFKNKFRYTDVLLIDDIHFFQEKVQVQEELFHTFNTLLDAKKQLAFTCDRPVSELKKVSERLMSRFDQCLKVDLQPPKYETRCAILKSSIELQNIQVPDEVIDLISKNVSTNIRDLISALNKLIAYTKLMGQPVTVENTRQQLRDVFASPRQANMSVDNIQRVVAEYFSLSPNDLKGKKRTQNIVFPRQLAMYIAREITEYSTTEIGQAFGGRDHTTVMHSCKIIEERIRSDPTLESTIESLKRMIKEYSAKS
jgi:chromosomal replication initiator protein